MLARTPAKERRLQEIMAQAVRTIAYWPSPEQDDMQAANMRKAAKEALKAWSAEASRCEHLMQESRVGVAGFSAKCLHCGAVLANTFQKEVTHDCADMKTLQQHVAGKWSRRAGYAARQPYPSREVLADLLAALNYRQYATNAEEDRLRKKIERALRDFNIATAKFVAPPAPDAATAQEN